MSTKSGPLVGIKVIEIASVIMGPYAASVLGDLGADVIKIETSDGDVGRNLGPARNKGMSALTLNLQRNKSSVVLDTKTEPDREYFEELIRGCDVLVTNLRPKSRERLGVSYEQLERINPGVILCTGQAYSSTSTMADQPAYDDIVQAASGICDLYRRVEGEPRYAPYVVADKVCGLMMAQGVLAALVHRERTGVGQWVDVPMIDAMISFNLVEHLSGKTFVPSTDPVGWNRTLVPERRPHRARDGWVCLMPYSDRNWKDFFGLVDRKDLLSDNRFDSNSTRHVNVAQLQSFLCEIAPTRTVAQWRELCTSADIPFQEVVDLDDLGSSEYARSRGILKEVTHPTEGDYIRVRFPMDFSASPVETGDSAPLLGEQTGRSWLPVTAGSDGGR
ncbi:crotonobetainyl-CoA:carnitine CoA-transferase CaiB-like acyl-CoA transferase [Rhodococcus sp. 27YEA15]|uniref:CaiB/BaiF CoA transferase family protein n=1 Tax=Rhodococcus sp. 27YEA15 TaxID=3156259 RepID=UPI003C7A8F44